MDEALLRLAQKLGAIPRLSKTVCTARPRVSRGVTTFASRRVK